MQIKIVFSIYVTPKYFEYHKIIATFVEQYSDKYLMNKQEIKGLVYVLTNSAMPGLVKIGMTTRSNMDIRMKELYSTGVPVPFECAYACEVKASDCAKIEHALHTAFAPNRINANREFFSISPQQAIVILELFNRKDITEEVSSEIENELTSEDKIAIEKSKSTRRPPLNYKEMGIPFGAKLTYTNDPSITVTVSSDRRVMYKNEEYSLTTVTKQLLGITRPIHPTPYWKYEDRNLRDIYDATYTMEE